MQKILRILLPLFAVLFFLFLFLSVLNIFRNPISTQTGGSQQGDAKSFHYAFYLPDSDYYFYRDLRSGASDAAGNLECAVSFHVLDDDPENIRLAEHAGYDGIAIYLYEENQAHREALESLREAGLPTVFIENAPTYRPEAFVVGTNSFESGKGIGRIAAAAEEELLDLTLVYSEKNPGLMTDSDLVEMGIREILGPRLRTLDYAVTGTNPLDAEILTYNMLREEPSREDSLAGHVIVLTDLNDTLVAIQTIIDLNLVGQVGIIGFGGSEAIQEYIDKSLLMGSIVRNPYRIGYSSIMALKEISDIGYTSAYVDTGISILSGGDR